MMARTHAGTGLLFATAGVLGSAVVGHPLSLVSCGVFAAVTVWSTVIPDVDHADGKIRYAFPPARAVYVALRWLVRFPWWRPAGHVRAERWMGHRRVTHSVLFALAAGAGAAVAAAMALPWLAGEVALVLPRVFGPLMVARADAVLVWLVPQLVAPVGPAVTTGCLAHITGDCFTKHGCPLWAPLSWSNHGPRWCTTGRESEKDFARVQGALTAGLFLAAGLVAAR